MSESHIPDFTRREILVAGAMGAALLAAGAPAMSAVASPGGGGDFDFLLGRWSVQHRKLKDRLAGSNEWIEFPGTLHVQPMLGGRGNIDENILDDPDGQYLATSIRMFHPASGEWSIYWVDGRHAGLDKPVIGRFEGRTGRFYTDDDYRSRPIRVRFTYENVSPLHARWSQAFSPDGGASWETNWTMDFRREARA